MRLFYLSLTILVISGAYGTTFKPVPYEHLIRSADAIVSGIYLDKKTIELDNGQLATQMSVKLEQSSGFAPLGADSREVLIHYPGGETHKSAQHVEGVPHFQIGERVLITLRELEDGRMWGQSLGLGSYKIVKIGEENFLINSIFPKNSLISGVNLKKFNEKVYQIKSEKMKMVHSDKYSRNFKKEYFQSVKQSKQKVIRSIASSSLGGNLKKVEDHEKRSPFWLIFLLSLMGLITSIVAVKRKS